MDATFVLAVLAAGFGAGLVLTAVGAGSLVSFPILVGAGLTPLVANVCNNVGLVPGGVTGAAPDHRRSENRPVQRRAE